MTDSNLDPTPAAESAGYFDFKGAQLYYVHHRTPNPKGAVVLAGPFATERPYSYVPWVGWARFLAKSGFAVIRFDYRGVGESTGKFANMTLADWMDDIEFAGDQLRQSCKGLPLLLHGLGFGGVLASRVFRNGVGDALLLWSAPASGKESMKEAFMRRLAMDYSVNAEGKKKSWQDYIDELNAGGIIPVQGYPFSGRLWRDSNSCQLYIPGKEEGRPDGRPCRQVKLDRSSAPLVAGIGQWRALNPALRIGYVPLNPNLAPLFEENLRWLEQALSTGKESVS